MKRVGILQYGGSFEQIASNPADKSLETYFAQQDTIRNVDALGARHGHCTLVSIRSPRPYAVDVSPASRALGLGLDPHTQAAEVLDHIAVLGFTHLLVQIPNPQLIVGLGRQPGLRVAAALADSFYRRGPRAAWQRRRLVAALNADHVEFVANHGPSAARHLVDIGVRHKPVVPFDYVFADAPADAPVKRRASDFGARIAYVGAVSHDKGVFDLVRAMAKVATAFPAASLTVVGEGPDSARLHHLVERLSLSGRVELVGATSHDDVIALLRDAAVSVVPSRHSYGEGLPLTIYEAWATRTPLVTTDHPVFAQRVIHEFTGLVTRERSPAALATAIVRVLSDDDLYERLSENATFGWELLKGSLSFWPLVSDWLDGRIVPPGPGDRIDEEPSRRGLLDTP